MSEPLIVTAAIIERNGRYLVTQRPLDKKFGGRWEFPGGRLEDGETLEECIKREVMEELGMEVVVLEEFARHLHHYENGPTIDLRAYVCDQGSERVQKKEIIDYRYLNPSQMSSYDILEADLPFVDKLMGLEVL